MAVKYDLSRRSKDAQQQGFEEIGIPRGFETETSTISKKYFHFNINQYRPNGYRYLRKNYEIECYFCHWIPKVVIPILMDEKFEKFKTEMFHEIGDRMKSIKSEIKNDFNTLVDRGVIETKDVPFENFKRKVEDLKEDDHRLFRIWSQLAFNDLPYDRSDTRNIDKIFGDIIETIKLSKRKNSTKQAVMELLDEFRQEGEFIMPEFSIEDRNVQLKWRSSTIE